MSSQPPEQIRAHLARVLKSQTFQTAGRMQRLLTFVVEQRLAVPEQPLKEVVIGSELYADASGEFDPRLTSVVRVDATRLRTKLREYYGGEGSGDALVIELPKGTYSPRFRAAAGEASRDAVVATAAVAISSEPSIAVLPFSNLSPAPDDYFSDGLTEEIIHALSSVPGIRVVARTSCFALKHLNADAREIGSALQVQLVLEGSVRKSGDTLRVTVQLVSTADGYQIWSRRYDRHIHDVFAVQDEIAGEIVRTLRVNAMAPARKQDAVGPGSYEAYAWYLRGRYHLNRQNGPALREAAACFAKAAEESPGYAAAHSGMAVAWLYLGYFAMERPLEVMPKAQEAAGRALAINEREPEALAVAASVKAMFDWDWREAEVLFRKALAIKAGADLSTHLFAMFVLLPMGWIAGALEMLEEARRVDPLSLFASASRGAVLLMARRPQEAEPEYRRALELDPAFWRAIVGLGRCYEARGQYEDAIACYERARVVSDGVPTAIGALGRAYAMAGRRKEAEALLLELDAAATQRYVSPYGRALIHLGLQDEQVFGWLDRSCEDRAAWVMYLASDPRFDELRGDERFRAVLRRMHLPMFEGAGR